MSNSFPPFIPM